MNKTMDFVEATVEAISATEKSSMSLPVSIVLSVLGGVVLFAVLVVALYCVCKRGYYRKRGSSEVEFFVPTTPATLDTVEKEIQNDTTEYTFDRFPNYSAPDLADNKRQSIDRRQSLGGIPASRFLHRRSSSMSAFEILPTEFDVDIYSGNESGDDGYKSPSVHGLGKLCFSMSYDRDGEKLAITLVRAIHLSPTGTKKSSDPYVKLVLLPDKKPKYVSKIVRRSLNPVFEETFNFSAQSSELTDKTIKMTVCDYDRFSRQVVIGYVTMSLKDVNFEATPWTGDIWRDIYNEAPCHIYKGELLFSLSFDPDKGVLRVCVLKSKDIKISEDKDIAGIYVKVDLLVAEKIIKMKKTKSQKRSSNPVFNDEFTFLVHPSLINDVSIMATVYSRNSFGRNRLVGKTNAGSFVYATGQGLEHWNDMLASPKSTVAHWHVIN